MRLSRRTALVLASVLGLLAVVLAYVYLRGQQPPPHIAQRASIPVPIEIIPVDTDLRADMFQQVSLEPGQVPKDSVIDPAHFYGSIALQELPKGKPVSTFAIAKRSAALALAYGIPEDHRAITVVADSVSGVGNFLRPGDHIDLLGMFADESGQYNVVQTVLQDIEILAVNTSTSPVVGGEEAKESEPKKRGGEQGRTITLAVTPHEAQLLALTYQCGDVRMTLRRTGDRRVEPITRSQSWSLIAPFPSPEGTKEPDSGPKAPSWADMWGGAPMQPPTDVKPTPTPKGPSVELIRGTSREIVSPVD